MKTYLCILLFSAPSIFLAQAPELVLPLIQNTPVTFVGFSPDGRLLASSSTDNVKIWEVATGRLIRTISAPENCKAAFSPDNKLLLTGTTIRPWDYEKENKAEIRLWDTETGKEIKKIHEFSEKTSVDKLEFDKNGRYFLASVAGKVMVWSLENFKLLRDFPGYGSFSHDGSKVLLLGKPMAMADIATGNITTIDSPVSEEPNESILERVLIKDEIVELTDAGNVKRWSISQQRQISSIPLDMKGYEYVDLTSFANDADMRAAGISEDGARIAMCLSVPRTSEEGRPVGRIVFWDSHTGKQIEIGPMVFKGSIITEEILGYWGKFAPNLHKFIKVPRTEVDDPRAGLLGYNTQTGLLSHEFGIKKLEWTVYKNQYFAGGPSDTLDSYMGVYNWR